MAGVNIPEQVVLANGSKFAVSAGKLSFTLTTPNAADQTNLAGFITSSNSPIDFRESDLGAVTASPSGVMYKDVHWFFYGPGGGSHSNIMRLKTEADGSTYRKETRIFYLYVSADVTLARAAGNFSTNNGSKTFNAINLPLKTGWNLVQTVDYQGNSGLYITVKIADTDVPWMIQY